MPLRPAPSRRVLATSPFAAPVTVQTAAEHVEVGDRVTHDRRGLGRVVRVVDEQDVIVNFGVEGVLTTVSHLKLTKL